MVEGVGFEPTKAEPTDLQSVPFGRSGTPPSSHIMAGASLNSKAGEGTRTPDRLITNQLLYQLSYSGQLFPDLELSQIQTIASLVKERQSFNGG